MEPNSITLAKSITLNTFTGTALGALGQGTDLCDNDMLFLLLPARVEDAVDDWIHAGVCAGENKQNLLDQVAHFTRTLLVKGVPVR